MKVKYKVTATTWIMITTAVVWFAWDVYAYITGQSTFSSEITKFSFYSPLAPLVIGILCGHFFWPAVINKNESKD